MEQLQKRCNNCGYFYHIDAYFCPKCGKPSSFTNSHKNNLVLLLLCLFLGWAGIHRFYVGKIASGIFQFLLCLITIGYIWVIIDFIVIASGNFRDANFKRISW